MPITFSSRALSLNIQRNLAQHTLAVERSMARLSSGLRITRAADDPAGLAIATRLDAKVRSTERAIRNALDGVSALQIGEGALNEVSGLLIRIRELAMQSANGSLGSAERATIDVEAQDLIREIDRIAQVTEFNGKPLLDGSGTVLRLQTGPDSGDTLDISGADTRASQLGTTDPLSGIDLSSAAGARAALDVADEAIDQISLVRARFGSGQVRLESQIRSLSISAENTEAARSRIMDVDIAAETAELARAQILQQFSITLLAQANQQQRLVLRLLETLG